MAFYVHDIREENPGAHPYYFIDTNIWIFILSGSRATKSSQPYLDFFESIKAIHLLEGKALKRFEQQKWHQPKILMSNLLMSEIFNVYMRKIAFRKYDYFSNYKHEFRQSQEHKDELDVLKRQFKDHMPFMHLVNDDFGNSLSPEELLSSFNSHMDFNDIFFYYLAQFHDVPIITQDRDFLFPDIKIITANDILLQHL